MAESILGSPNISSAGANYIQLNTTPFTYDYTHNRADAEDRRYNLEAVDPNKSVINLPTGVLLTKIRFTSTTTFTWTPTGSSSNILSVYIGWREGTGNLNFEIDHKDVSKTAGRVTFAALYSIDAGCLEEYGKIMSIFTLVGNGFSTTISNLRITTAVEIDNIYPAFPD